MIEIGEEALKGGVEVTNYGELFLVMTVCENVPWAGHERGPYKEPGEQDKWIKQLFSHFPDIILPKPRNSSDGDPQESAEEVSTWSIMIPPTTLPVPRAAKPLQQTSKVNTAKGKGKPGKGKRGGTERPQGPTQKPAVALKKVVKAEAT